MHNIFIVEDPFSINSKNDWDNEPTEKLEISNTLKIKILEDDYVFPYGDDTTLNEIERIENANRVIVEDKQKEVVDNEPFVLV